MKVKELIEQLQEFSEDVVVRVEMGDTYGTVVDLELEDNSQYGKGLQFVYIIAKGDR